MAAVEITISGVLFDKLARTTRPVTIVGEAVVTGLGVGGGPIMPPEAGSPPGIWGGGNVPMPTPPIANVPGAPGYRPPGIWGGPIDPYPDHGLPGQQPHPEHPIVLPPDPEWPGSPPSDAHPEHPIVLPPPNLPGPPEDGAGKPPPPGGGWGWSPEYGWGYFPGQGGKPQPGPGPGPSPTH